MRHKDTAWIASIESSDHLRLIAPLSEFYLKPLVWLDRNDGELVPREAFQAMPAAPPTAKVLCAGLNYRSHAAEVGRDLPTSPELFARWASTLSIDGAEVPLPANEPGLDWEGELAAIVARPLRNVTADEAEDGILGFTILNDLSARMHQRASRQWGVGKNADGSAPMGPWIITGDELGEPYDLTLTTRVDGTVVQQASTSDLIFRVGDICAHASECMTLQPGDVISTGTPAGVGIKHDPPRFLTEGMTVEVEIERIGTLSNRIGAVARGPS